MRWLSLSLFLLLAGCLSVPSFLSGGGSGTNVAANTQLGKTNNQTIGSSSSTDQTLKVETVEGTVNQSSDKNKLSAESVGDVLIQDIPPWVMILLILRWLLPTPTQIGNSIVGFFRWLLKR